MTSTPVQQGGLERFEPHRMEGSRLLEEAQGLIEEGKLPIDALFKVASLGCNQIDPLIPDRRFLLSFSLVSDMVANYADPEGMRPDTRTLLDRPRAQALVDPNSNWNRLAYRELDPMYYRLADLATEIKLRREEQGKTMTKVPRRWWQSVERYEWTQCVGLARPVWRIIVKAR